jgi:cytochrome P450
LLDLEKLTYLAQVRKESLRVCTPGPFAARLTQEEMVLGTITVPKGNTIKEIKKNYF